MVKARSNSELRGRIMNCSSTTLMVLTIDTSFKKQNMQWIQKIVVLIGDFIKESNNDLKVGECKRLYEVSIQHFFLSKTKRNVLSVRFLDPKEYGIKNHQGSK